jgi:hypothetical protein
MKVPHSTKFRGPAQTKVTLLIIEYIYFQCVSICLYIYREFYLFKQVSLRVYLLVGSKIFILVLTWKISIIKIRTHLNFEFDNLSSPMVADTFN